MQNITILGAFLTGLVTGGLTCMAVQGGLLAATIAQNQEERLQEKVKSGSALPILTFLSTKLLAYAILGFLLGMLGSFFKFSLPVQIFFQITVVIFMIGTSLNILNVHPIFRYFVIQPPKFITRRIRQQSKSGSIFAPALLGALTVFIPCGTTQVMMLAATGSSNPFLGAAILGAFVLGTSPIFFILGYFATKLGDSLHEKFMKISAYAIILLALFNLNSAISLTGSTVTFDKIVANIYCTFSYCSDNSTSLIPQALASEATINIGTGGYTPNNFSVKAGSEVKLHLVNHGGGGCASAFTIPTLGIQKVVPIGSSEDVSFTAPSKPGPLAFMCSMGMYKGTIHVI